MVNKDIQWDIELTATVRVVAKSEDEAHDKARKEVSDYPYLLDVTYCGKGCEEGDEED